MFMQYLDPQSSFSQVLGGALSSTNIHKMPRKFHCMGSMGSHHLTGSNQKTCWKLPKPLIKYTEKTSLLSFLYISIPSLRNSFSIHSLHEYLQTRIMDSLLTNLLQRLLPSTKVMKQSDCLAAKVQGQGVFRDTAKGPGHSWSSLVVFAHQR